MPRGSTAIRDPLTGARLHAFMRALADSAPPKGPFRVYFVGGATAVAHGWRASTLDADVSADDDRVFGEIQKVKEDLRLNVELARPEDFVPALSGAKDRHLFIETFVPVSFFHYDPYSQLFAKLVRGFRLDMEDAAKLVSEGLVEPEPFRKLVYKIPPRAYSKYPALSREAILEIVDRFVARHRS